mgnify:CR=1 FL=1
MVLVVVVPDTVVTTSTSGVFKDALVSLSTSVGGATIGVGYIFDTSKNSASSTDSALGMSAFTASVPMGPVTISAGVADHDNGETSSGASASMALGGGTASIGYASTDETTDSTATSVAYSGSLDADTSYSIGYTTGEQGSNSSQQLEAKISRSLGGGVSVFADFQNHGGAGTPGTNMALGTSMAF